MTNEIPMQLCKDLERHVSWAEPVVNMTADHKQKGDEKASETKVTGSNTTTSLKTGTAMTTDSMMNRVTITAKTSKKFSTTTKPVDTKKKLTTNGTLMELSQYQGDTTASTTAVLDEFDDDVMHAEATTLQWHNNGAD
ncbi:hypothetical protein PInf_005873 [Phytophthora infestans]|nr:hypothetical protein PInf_005873 [Phytophthora infestans]